ncbi:hypothetical protein APUTEX25_005173 [Auxenochlorella protothecoides]|uniref:Uncharacterized protein n=1 Tax=Auxenochlorella protothecoides TaxID=3075 RepID=A0A3M7KTL6_AUXPR|nr:hypothetical protein APUTEX25_005173 [Auxenochlorella protothecoides]|eukprot:RMZ53184.1 hypothetical protein APUTEX25_005173 [Auxenochlorella protothecoides]
MGASRSKLAYAPEDTEVEQITTVFAPTSCATPATDPLLSQLQSLEHSLPIIPSSLKVDWREIQRYTIQPVADGLGSVHALIETYLKRTPNATRAAILAELRAFVHEMRAPGPDTDALLEKLEGAVRGLYASVHSVQRMEPPVVADSGVRVA